MGYQFVRWVTKIVMALIAHVELIDWDKLPKQGSLIITGNHAGRIEVVLLYYLLDRKDIILIIAEKYRDNHFWRWFAKRVDGIFIDRFGADFAAMREVLKRLQKGGVLVIAPEGTRSLTGKLQEARPGAAYLAAKSGVPVVPVAATGTWDEDVYGGLRRFKRAQVTLRIGDLYTIPSLKPHNRDVQLQEATDEMMCRIAALMPDELRGFYADHPRLIELLNSSATESAA